MNFCRDCSYKWAKTPSTPSSQWECKHPNNGVGRLDPVSGEKLPLYQYCLSHRTGPGGCGEEGKWFHANP